MRAFAISAAILGAVLAVAQPAHADEFFRGRFDVRLGGRDVRVVERRDVVFAGHYETRYETITDPGRFETRERQVWVAGGVVYERRARIVPVLSVNVFGARVYTNTTVYENVAVERPGHWTTVCEQVWIPGCTHTVARQVWVAECRR